MLDNNRIELSNAPKEPSFDSATAAFNHKSSSENLDSGASISSVLNLDEENWHLDWADCLRSGICIRPRALTNTLFLRYVVADLFVHGIGGGIYDAVTDEIAQELWGLKPLAMQVVSASLFLPIGDAASSKLPAPEDTNPVLHERKLHRLRSAPETFLDPSNPTEAAIQFEFEQLLASRPDRGNRKTWHVSMKKLRQTIRLMIDDRESQLRAISRSLVEHERRSRILRSRETSFVLFPEADITHRLGQLLPSESFISI